MNTLYSVSRILNTSMLSRKASTGNSHGRFFVCCLNVGDRWQSMGGEVVPFFRFAECLPVVCVAEEAVLSPCDEVSSRSRLLHGLSASQVTGASSSQRWAYSIEPSISV